MKCPEPCIRQEELDKQLSSLIKSVSLPKDWAEELLKMGEKDFKNSAQSNSAFVKEKQNKISSLLQKKSLEEEIYNLSHKQNNWLEPMKEWIKDAQNPNGIARDSDLFAKKVKAKEIFGSNLLLQNKTVRPAEGGTPFRTQNSLAKTGETAWACLTHAHSLFLSKPFSSFKVTLPG